MAITDHFASAGNALKSAWGFLNEPVLLRLVQHLEAKEALATSGQAGGLGSSTSSTHHVSERIMTPMQPQVTYAKSDGGLNVSTYASDVAERYARSPDEKGKVVYAHAHNAEMDTGGKVGFTAAQRIAEASINAYEKYRSEGRPHEKAVEQTVSDVSQRYSSAGKDREEAVRETHKNRDRGAGL